MKLSEFKLEAYLSEHEFRAPHLLCCSDAEAFSMADVVAKATPSEQSLWSNLRLGYTEVPGTPLLRHAIRENMYPGLVHDDAILAFSGAEEGIFCALSVLANAGDHVIVLTPCYQSLTEIPKAQGASVTQVSLREENAWRVDVDEIRRAIRPNTTLLVMNFPHNPTGQVISADVLNDVVALCHEYNLWLFSDEVYRLLGNPSGPWAPPAVLMYEKALSLGVMSKAFGMAGLRIGWIACRDTALLKKLELVKHYTTICCSGPAEILSIIALNNHRNFIGRNNEIVASNLELLDKFMAENTEQFSWVRPQGGCVGLVKYNGGDGVDKFCQDLLRAVGVLLLPAAVYDVPTPHFRIGYGRKNMPIALDKMAQFIHGRR